MLVAPYGAWKSPITSDLIVAGTIKLVEVAWDGGDIYWLEMRPSEGGRNVLVRRTPDGTITDVTPGVTSDQGQMTKDKGHLTTFNVRTRVHEYGGGAFAVAAGVVYFSNVEDGRIYRQEVGGVPEPLTPIDSMRYADFAVDRARNRLICIREDHSGDGEPVNTIVAVGSLASADPKPSQVLVAGSDFYSSPRLSPDGNQLCWLSWHHPQMPWDGTELWVASVNADGSLGEAQLVAGGPEESIFQPEWSPDGVLYFVSDRSATSDVVQTRWWNLYRRSDRGPEALCPMEAEFGLPQWVFGMSTYSFASAEQIVCTYTQQGIWYLATLNLTTGDLQTLTIPYTSISSPQVEGNRVLFLGGHPTLALAVVVLDLETKQIEVLRRSAKVEIDMGFLSPVQPVEFPTTNGRKAYGIFYPPQNRDYSAPPDSLPPLLVKSHGGPTAATSTSLNLSIQYWTSRGFAVLDVNYGGSTGYGREYRSRLDGLWGVVDVDDCVNGALHLAALGLVDGNRMAIAGGSAGGYTTLCALTFRDVFKAGASYYGVSDLEALARDTHKFEARYLDRLIGPYPDRQDLYQERSPIHHCAHLSCPVIFFQGLEDKVVPPNQTEKMVESLKAKGLPVAYIPIPGEQHGFRRAENIKRALEGEFYFYSRVFGFEPADDLPPVPIHNL
ncbi:MAG TPA: S9 family peptidase [Oscillatoriaceae cyanobacterium M33_DOE_052]|uniref:S9 family peptidase n=1 Tax=Planktothricoides sp. SpSt-374 TaxID=2282167 RepID=A0A7C3ZKJ5_9CYAN|nr:S9 family peptidase [Oscillatoriaceae cyanobacterium M33_DOE_052]